MDTCILYSYIILLLIFFLFFMKAEDREITNKNTAAVAVITALLGALRAEGILFLAFVPVIFVIINYHKIKIKQIVFFVLFLLFMTAVFIPKYIDISFISAQEGKYEGVYKKLYMMDYSFKVLLKEAAKRKDREILSEFDEVAEKLFEKYQKTYIIYKIKDSLFISYNHATYKIGIEKINFSDNKGAKKAYNRIDDNLLLYCNDVRNYCVDFFKKHSTSKGSLIMPLVIVLFVLLFSSLFMKKTLFFTPLLVLVHSFSVSLLAPYGAFRYNFSLYLYGYLILTIFIISIIYNLTAVKKLKYFI
ncbi:MAG: hypothetical protein VB017_08090 [Endomicrobiaceae bacterium]|nr:hypothetical protein [Endomicrobiaceae bacterium]